MDLARAAATLSRAAEPRQSRTDRVAGAEGRSLRGGTTGIGFACARLFRNEGARVAITGRTEANISAAKDSLGDDVLAIRADVSRIANIEAMADEVRAAFGGLDGLLVNAGIAKFRPYQEMDETTFDEIMDVNVKGAWFTIARCAP